MGMAQRKARVQLGVSVRARRRPREVVMTTAEYLMTPETLQPRELIFGVLHAADSPFIPHQRVVGALFKALDAHVRARGLGEVILSPMDVVLDGPRGLVVQPDLLFVSRSRADIVADHVWGAPDLVVEVLSPPPRAGRVNERIAWFARYGVTECWLVDQIDRRVDVLRFDAGAVSAQASFARREPIASSVLPGFRGTLDGIAGW
jgi:Uma2 family endonuclease